MKTIKLPHLTAQETEQVINEVLERQLDDMEAARRLLFPEKYFSETRLKRLRDYLKDKGLIVII